MKRPSRWSTSPTIQTAQGTLQAGEAEVKKSEESVQRVSLLSGASLILSPSQIRTRSTSWLLVLHPMEFEMDMLRAKALSWRHRTPTVRRARMLLRPYQEDETQDYARSCNIRNKATSPSCSSSNLRVNMIKCPWKNSWSTVWCLRHQPWNTSGFFSTLNKAATLHYHLEDITPEDLPYPKDALFIQDRTTLLHNLTILPRHVAR